MMDENKRKQVARIAKVPHETGPLKTDSSFVLGGHVYRVSKVKSRGRLIVRHLGIVDDGGGE